jgi:hypothetical protein
MEIHALVPLQNCGTVYMGNRNDVQAAGKIPRCFRLARLKSLQFSSGGLPEKRLCAGRGSPGHLFAIGSGFAYRRFRLLFAKCQTRFFCTFLTVRIGKQSPGPARNSITGDALHDRLEQRWWLGCRETPKDHPSKSKSGKNLGCHAMA